MEQRETTTIKILKYSLWGCLYLTFLMPLLVGTSFIFPFISLKTFYFRIVVEVALLLYILLALASSYYRPKMNKLIWLIIAFGLIIFITGLIGLNPYKSFWGTIERGEGFVFISHLFIFCLIASQTFKTRKEWFNFLSGSITISLIVGIYALGQKFNASWAVVNSNGARLASTLGNPSYLGAYALGLFWLSLLLFFSRKKIWWKIIFIATALFNLYLLVQTQTRGAMLGLVISLFLVALAYIVLNKSKKVKIILSLILLIFISSVFFIWFNRQSDWVRSSSSLSRLANIRLTQITVESRLLALDSSWQGWQNSFLLGYGWENYNIVFNKYFHPKIYRDNGSQIWFDRAHNTILDVAVATGLVGLLTYLGIYLAAILIILSLLRRNRYRNIHLAIMLFGFLSAHFFQNIFVFDSLPTYLMLFTVFGFIAYLGSEQEHYRPDEIKQKPLNIYALSVGIIVLFFVAYNLNIKPARANIKALDAMRMVYSGQLDKSFKLFDQAIGMRTYQSVEIRNKIADNILSKNIPANVKDAQKRKANFVYAIKHMKDNIKANPYDVQHYIYLMALYNAATYLDPNYIAQAIETGNRAIKIGRAHV